MRVISGSARRTNLKTVPGESTRPTTDRIKETLFNMIQGELYDCLFLDLFSGSGAIGIEALSRGARRCYFVEQAKEAEQMGADYLGVGAVFGTTTKGDANKISMEVLKEICESVSIPVVAIGGVCEENILNLKGSGVAGVAVVSGIYAKPNIKESSKKLAELAKEITK